MRTLHPFWQTCLCLAPLTALVCAIWAGLGSETAVFAYFSASREASPAAVWWMTLFTNTGNVLFYGVYAAIFIRAVRRRDRATVCFALAYALAQVFVAALLCRIVKIAVGRPRPMTGGPFVPFSFGWGYQSFPSGHTVEAVGTCLPLTWRYGTVFLPLGLGVFVAAMGFSRLYLGMHHPSDVLGGMLFGCCSGYLARRLAPLLQNCRLLPFGTDGSGPAPAVPLKETSHDR